MANVAQRVIIPSRSGIFRAVFLYTGQGDSTLMVIPKGHEYIYVLVDSDLDKDPNEINLVKMFKDLFEGRRGLDLFINTHPHNDHIGGIRDIYDEIGFPEVWHSNHKPGGQHRKKYEDLSYVIKKVGKEREFHLKGTNGIDQVRDVSNERVTRTLGDIHFQVLSPAEFLCEEIDEAKPDERDRRIHEQCGVIKFTYGRDPKSILMTGDSDKCAWERIMYHKNMLDSVVLHASHHGSNTFFRNNDDDEVYEEHMKNILPELVVVSAPKRNDSPHGHPHEFAMDKYEEYVGKKGLKHLGEKPYSLIVDIDSNGVMSVSEDTELIRAYRDNGDDDDDGGGNNDRTGPVFTPRSKVSEPDKGERFA